MKKIIIAMVLGTMVFFSYHRISNALEFDMNRVIETKYKAIGKVGEYTLYKDTSVQFFAEALEPIYEDEKHIYYLPVISSHIYQLCGDDETIGLKEALQENKISIDHLKNALPQILVIEK